VLVTQLNVYLKHVTRIQILLLFSTSIVFDLNSFGLNGLAKIYAFPFESNIMFNNKWNVASWTLSEKTLLFWLEIDISSTMYSKATIIALLQCQTHKGY